MVHHYVPTIHPFHRHFVNFPAPRHCHACSKSSHITAFGRSRPPCHPHPGVTPLQHRPQRPFFWEAGTLIGGPPPLPSYPQQHFAHAHVPTSISSQIALHLDLPVCPCHSSTQGSLAHHWPQRPSFQLVGAPIKCPPPPPISLWHSMHARTRNPAAFPHLDASVCPCQPSWRTFSPLISPSGSNFPMGGVLGTHHTLFPPFQLLHIHVHPLWPTRPPPRLCAHLRTLLCTSTHLCTPCVPFFPGFFLHPLHFLCPGTLPSLSHGPWVGKFFLLGKNLAVVPRGLRRLGPKVGIGVLGYPCLHTDTLLTVWHHKSWTFITILPHPSCYHFWSTGAQEHPPTCCCFLPPTVSPKGMQSGVG